MPLRYSRGLFGSRLLIGLGAKVEVVPDTDDQTRADTIQKLGYALPVGWGDDVEIGLVWEIITLVNPDASPAATETVRGIAEGVWWGGEIDRTVRQDGTLLDEEIEQIARPDSPVYGCDAFWNTFWNLNQLWALMTPRITRQWVDSLLEIYDQGGWLPKGPTGIEYSGIMEAWKHYVPLERDLSNIREVVEVIRR